MTSKTDSTAKGFIKLMRHDDVEQLIVQKPKAFLLLTLIAWRARRSDERCKFTGLDQGQAMIGDYKSCGLSRQEYRTALRWLEANQFVTIKATSKGTIATVTSTDVYDINAEGANHQTTIKQPSTNHQLTTNKNVKNEKNENKESRSAPEEALESVPAQQSKALAPQPSPPPKKKKAWVPPTEVEVRVWAGEWAQKKEHNPKGVCAVAEEARQYYERMDWKNRNGKQVQVWKTTIAGVWLTDEKITKATTGSFAPQQAIGKDVCPDFV
jgi:hypothetical protein